MPNTTKLKARESKILELLKSKSENELWWLAPKRGEDGDETGIKVARAVHRAATNREISNIPTRWRSYVFFREVTGRPSLSQLAYGMAKRPQSFVNYYSSFQFTGVKSRSAAQVCDVYVNRLLGHQTFVSFLPDNGDFEETRQCQEREAWVEAGFDQLKYWSVRTAMGTEALWYGTGCVAFRTDSAGNPHLEAKNMDELLYSNPDDPDPYDVIDRTWAKKTELIQKYKDNLEACEAIANATSAYPAFYFGRGSLDCTDVVPYLVAYTHPMGKTPGRHVECIGDYTLVDEDWNYPHPYELWQFSQFPGSMFGQGLVEQVLQVCQWIDGILSVMQESEQRGGAGKWLYDENSNVNPDTLGDTIAAAVSYLGKEPKYITPEGVGQWTMQHLDALMNLLRQIAHISEQAIKGEAPKAFTSGVALEKYAEIDDQTFLEKIGRLEEFDRRCAYQLLMLGQRTKCNFIRKGQDQKWEDLKWNPNYRISNIQAYNVGRLSQTVAGRIELLKEMYAEKTIDKRLYIKFQQTPDIHGMFTELNSPIDDIQAQLDALVKSDDYISPSPFMDFAFAIQLVESRYAKEEAKNYGKDEKKKQAVLDRLSLWRATVMSMAQENATPDVPPQAQAGLPAPAPGAAPPGPGFGIAPPPEQAGVAPLQPSTAQPQLPALNTNISPAPGGLPA